MVPAGVFLFLKNVLLRLGVIFEECNGMEVTGVYTIYAEPGHTLNRTRADESVSLPSSKQPYLFLFFFLFLIDLHSSGGRYFTGKIRFWE